MMTSLGLKAQEVCLLHAIGAFRKMYYVGTVRELLKVHPFEVVEINTTNYPTLEVHTMFTMNMFLYLLSKKTTYSCSLKAHHEIKH